MIFLRREPIPAAAHRQVGALQGCCRCGRPRIMPDMAPRFIRETVRDMEGYTPGEQPRLGERVVKLNTNENPFPPSEKVMAVLRNIEAESLRRYPNPTAEMFRA